MFHSNVLEKGDGRATRTGKQELERERQETEEEEQCEQVFLFLRHERGAASRLRSSADRRLMTLPDLSQT